MGDFDSIAELGGNQMILINLTEGGKPVKKYKRLLYCALALTMLVGLALPLASIPAQAADYTLTVLNPMGQIAPKNNIPLADRQPLLDKLEACGAQGSIRVLLLPYAKNGDELWLWALGIALKERWEAQYPGTTLDLVQTDFPGGPLTYAVMPPAWDWMGQGTVPHLTSPWGAKTGHSYIDGMPLKEEPFDRYQFWANNFDFVLTGEEN